MRDFPFSSESLFNFSNSDPYQSLPPYRRDLFEQLDSTSKRLNFPAIANDVGGFLAFISGLLKPKRIFEMGSGYGHSAFWYFIGGGDFIEEVTLTEKRSDMEEVFHALPWPVNWKKRMSFHNEDAFEVLEREQGRFDLILIDGVKADYKAFLQAAFNKLSKGGVVAIDNSFWRGSFLNEASRKKNLSARKIAELHRFIADLEGYETLFLPFKDGLTVLRKKN